MYFIKNTTTSIQAIAPNISQPSCPLEDLSGTFTQYRFATNYSLMKLDAYEAVTLASDGTRWHVVMFFGGNPTVMGRTGGSFREVLAANITDEVLYGSLNTQHLLVNLPAPTSRRFLVIVADRNGTDNANQIQLNAHPSGPIDGRFLTLNMNISFNRRGNCGIFLFSDNTTWHIASIFSMADMDNFSSGTVTPTSPALTSQVGIVTNPLTSPSVWAGRSYNVASVAPTASLSAGQTAFRVFKQYNTASAGFGLKTSDGGAYFPETYTAGANSSTTQMFKYNSSYLMSFFCLEFIVAGTRKILFVNQYPSDV
jgi:hypothetical protein